MTLKKGTPRLAKYKCPVCNHSKRAEIEQAYLEWESLNTIARKHSVSANEIRKHIIEKDLKQVRANHCQIVLEKVIEKGLKNPKDPDWSDVLKAVRQINELQGKFVERKAVLHMGLSEEQREKEYEKILDKLNPEILEIMDGEE